MKKIVKFTFALLSILICNITHAQIQVDTIIKTQILECYFSYKYHNPLMVKYILYKGGGECNRSQFKFVTDNVKNSATPKDYIASGYDEGHLANAEDFANDCNKEKLTFKFYNCVPQTPNLNRGIWKHYETEIRKLSQTDSLLVVCGCIYDGTKIPNTEVAIPKYCWKVVKSLKTNKILYVLWFTNEMETNSVKTTMTLQDLEKTIGYKTGL